MANETGFGLHWLDLGREARMVAYIACKERSGKIKLKELKQLDRVRDALLDGCDIDVKAGKVEWQKGMIRLQSQDDFETFVRMVKRYLEDEGVEFDLSKGALELITTIESKEGELALLIKEQQLLAKEQKALATPPGDAD